MTPPAPDDQIVLVPTAAIQATLVAEVRALADQIEALHTPTDAPPVIDLALLQQFESHMLGLAAVVKKAGLAGQIDRPLLTMARVVRQTRRQIERSVGERRRECD